MPTIVPAFERLHPIPKGCCFDHSTTYNARAWHEVSCPRGETPRAAHQFEPIVYLAIGNRTSLS